MRRRQTHKEVARQDFQSIFVALRAVLHQHRGAWSVEEDSATCYSLAGCAGPAALRAWGGKLKRPKIPIAWVQIGKAYVSYHLMGVYGNARLLDGMSEDLKARMQGKTCFNFKSLDAVRLRELDEITVQAITGFKKSGYVSEPNEVSHGG